MSAALTPAARVAAALGHREGDRVPFFLPANMHGARLLGVPLTAYLGSAELVVQGQLRLRELLGHDAVSGFLCAAAEAEPFGGEVVVHEDGPPNTGEPPLRSAADIERLRPPDPTTSPTLRRSLEATAALRAAVGAEVPVLAGGIGPFSLPAIQVGLDRWFELLHQHRPLAERLLRVNEAFCASWANALLAAGASAVALAEPLASPLLVPADRYRELGLPALRRTVAAVRGPVAVSTASAPCLPIAADLAGAGVACVGVSAADDLSQSKRILRGRAAVMGNLNGLEMRHWTPDDAEQAVRAALAAGGPGGGFVLSEHHGEVPFQVPLEVLQAVAEAVRRWGTYPLRWADAG
ncbi:MAG: uroporphyrinogen decarboxylase family protein [Deltaproteobacteria bacterium]|nr:uroporphyrinogen decarboxylase family protein [Deltaproteobacteria bacterium]